jgi:excisionase family DNA binding protein
MISLMTLWTQWTSRRLTSDGLVPIMPSMQQPLLTSDEVAKILKVSRSYAYLMLKRGDIPAVHVGSSVRVRPEDLELYINSNAARGDPATPSLFDED